MLQLTRLTEIFRNQPNPVMFLKDGMLNIRVLMVKQ